jgi:hypothetical protein
VISNAVKWAAPLPSPKPISGNTAPLEQLA